MWASAASMKVKERDWRSASGVEALSDLRRCSAGFLASLGEPGGGIRPEPKLLALAADHGAIDPRAAQAACARTHQHDQAVGGRIGVLPDPEFADAKVGPNLLRLHR